MTTFPLRTVRLRSGEEMRETVAIALEPFLLAEQQYLPVPAVTDAELVIQRATSGDVLSLAFRARLHGPCMRCLDDAVLDVDVGASEYHAVDPKADDELRSEYVAEGGLELSRWARDAIAEVLPDQILCEPGCPGLCTVCGERLADGPHDHGDAPPDPRWAALEALRGSD